MSVNVKIKSLIKRIHSMSFKQKSLQEQLFK